MNKEEELYKNRYRIKSTRMPGWDYSWSGYYFITICTRDQICHFGDIIDERMLLTEFGNNADIYWNNIPKHFPFVKIDDYIIMPNHVHGIIIIQKNILKSQCVVDNKPNRNAETQIGDSGNHGYNTNLPCLDKNNTSKRNIETQNLASLQTNPKNKFGPQSMNLASIIRGFKIGVKKYANNNKIIFNWQPRYYDRIIRNEKELYNTRKYIQNNPKKWDLDRNNPININ